MADSNLKSGINFLTLCRCAEVDMVMLLKYIVDYKVPIDEGDKHSAEETLTDLRSTINSLSA